MKYYKSISFALAALVMLMFGYETAFSKSPEFPGPPVLSLVEESYDFGEIEKGVPVEHTFYFSNTGEEALLITNIKTSCGCTAAEFSKEPIPAGEEGFVKVRYNASKPGAFSKTISITANTEVPGPVLTIRGKVMPE